MFSMIPQIERNGEINIILVLSVRVQLPTQNIYDYIKMLAEKETRPWSI